MIKIRQFRLFKINPQTDLSNYEKSQYSFQQPGSLKCIPSKLLTNNKDTQPSFGDIIDLCGYKCQESYFVDIDGKSLIANYYGRDLGYLEIPWNITQHLRDAIIFYKINSFESDLINDYVREICLRYDSYYLRNTVFKLIPINIDLPNDCVYTMNIFPNGKTLNVTIIVNDNETNGYMEHNECGNSFIDFDLMELENNTKNFYNELITFYNDFKYKNGLNCICGSNLKVVEAENCYDNFEYVECDVCDKNVKGMEKVYHCVGNKSDQHTNGYDLCDFCSISLRDMYFGKKKDGSIDRKRKGEFELVCDDQPALKYVKDNQCNRIHVESNEEYL